MSYNVDVVQIVKGNQTRTMDHFRFTEADESKKFVDTFNKFYVPADKAEQRTATFLMASSRVGR